MRIKPITINETTFAVEVYRARRKPVRYCFYVNRCRPDGTIRAGDIAVRWTGDQATGRWTYSHLRCLDREAPLGMHVIYEISKIPGILKMVILEAYETSRTS